MVAIGGPAHVVVMTGRGRVSHQVLQAELPAQGPLGGVAVVVREAAQGPLGGVAVGGLIPAPRAAAIAPTRSGAQVRDLAVGHLVLQATVDAVGGMRGVRVRAGVVAHTAGLQEAIVTPQPQRVKRVLRVCVIEALVVYSSGGLVLFNVDALVGRPRSRGPADPNVGRVSAWEGARLGPGRHLHRGYLGNVRVLTRHLPGIAQVVVPGKAVLPGNEGRVVVQLSVGGARHGVHVEVERALGAGRLQRALRHLEGFASVAAPAAGLRRLAATSPRVALEGVVSAIEEGVALVTGEVLAGGRGGASAVLGEGVGLGRRRALVMVTVLEGDQRVQVLTI